MILFSDGSRPIADGFYTDRYACGNSKILNGLLKDELGFQGFVQSDWLAQRSGVASALAGLYVARVHSRTVRY